MLITLLRHKNHCETTFYCVTSSTDQREENHENTGQPGEQIKMNLFGNFARLCLLAMISFAVTGAASAAQLNLNIDRAISVENTYQSMIHKIHSTTVNEDGSRTTRHCKNETECRYCTKKCLAPAKCIAKDCCTEWSKAQCIIAPPPKDLKTFN